MSHAGTGFTAEQQEHMRVTDHRLWRELVCVECIDPDLSTVEPPYPWCIGAPTVKDCKRAMYCRRAPSCGD